MERTIYLKLENGMNSLSRVMNLLKYRRFAINLMNIEADDDFNWDVNISIFEKNGLGLNEAKKYLNKLIDVKKIRFVTNNNTKKTA